MTRIIMISDTHHGGTPEGYRMQTAYIDRLPELLAALGRWITETGGAELVLHGGDTVERADPVLMAEAAAQLAVLPAPVRLVVGNHEVTAPGALDHLVAAYGSLFPDGVSPENPGAYSLPLADCTVHVLPTHWGRTPYYWDGGRPEPCLAPQDLAMLEVCLACEPQRPQLVACHAAPAGIPAAQLGRSTDGEAPPAVYAAVLRGVAQRHPNVRLFLSGHSHINSMGSLGPAGARWLMATSFSESPFECREIVVNATGLTVRTVPMHGLLDWHAGYDWDAAYVQGRPCERSLTLTWKGLA